MTLPGVRAPGHLELEVFPPMRTLSSLVILLVFTAATSLAQENIRTISQILELDPDEEIEIVTYKGTITVSPWDRPDVQLDVSIEAEDVDGLIMLPHVEIEVKRTARGLYVETDYRAAIRELRRLFENVGAQRLPLVHYVIQIPRTAGLKIDDHMSSITLSDVQSSVDLFTYKGVVEVMNFGGALKLDTFRGIARVSFGNLSRDSSVDTHEGTIFVRLPRNTSFNLDIDLGDPEAVFAADTSFVSIGGVTRAYHGSFNGGGPRLNMITHRGSLQLSSN
jgi:hypothetical protein